MSLGAACSWATAFAAARRRPARVPAALEAGGECSSARCRRAAVRGSPCARASASRPHDLLVAWLTAPRPSRSCVWRGSSSPGWLLALGVVRPRSSSTSAGFAACAPATLGRRAAVHLVTGVGFGGAFVCAGLVAAIARARGLQRPRRPRRPRRAGARADRRRAPLGDEALRRERSRSTRSISRSTQGEVVALARPERRGQDDRALDPARAAPARRGPRGALRRRPATGARPRVRIGVTPQDRRFSADAARSRDRRSRPGAFPGPSPRSELLERFGLADHRGPAGGRSLGRRAAPARGRARLRRQPACHLPRRADDRARRRVAPRRLGRDRARTRPTAAPSC